MRTNGTSRGVPAKIARDAWWLDAGSPGSAGPALPGDGSRRSGGTAGLPLALSLALLIALADLLFWGRPPGLSLAAFAAAVFCIATADIALRHRWRPGVVLLIASLPVVEHAQALSAAFLLVGTAGALVWARMPAGTVDDLGPATIRLLRRLPFGGLAALCRAGWQALPAGAAPDGPAQPATAGRLRALLRDWAFPVGGAVVFASLLIDANPVLARLVRVEIDVTSLTERAIFWLGIGLLIWPLVDRSPPRGDPIALPRLRLGLGLGINGGSTLRALVVFNLLIGVQTVLDLSILSGGAALPQGMSYAEYAHRGAYPLLLTALLAGGFAVAARPYLDERRAIRPLMLLWLGQNVALCLSALLRLDLYVGAYGLTYLRLYAMIWMGLVATGLALVGTQVWQRRSSRWLVVRTTALAGGVLYGCAFVNFAAIIAGTNLAGDGPRDWAYLCSLDRTAAAAIRQGIESDPSLRQAAIVHGCPLQARAIEGWRDFGFRDWRVGR